VAGALEYAAGASLQREYMSGLLEVVLVGRIIRELIQGKARGPERKYPWKFLYNPPRR
jgi:hypothetical protein